VNNQPKPVRRWPGRVIVAGSIAMLGGAVDPLEGSLVILAGSALVAIGTFPAGGRARKYWLWVLALVAAGVGAMWALSAVGGIGGGSGRSMWWGLVIVPYPVGWLLGLGGTIARLVQHVRARRTGA
jgi:hypothetical protein